MGWSDHKLNQARRWVQLELHSVSDTFGAIAREVNKYGFTVEGTGSGAVATSESEYAE